jgi:hypothetical protein
MPFPSKCLLCLWTQMYTADSTFRFGRPRGPRINSGSHLKTPQRLGQAAHEARKAWKIQ